ncbi:MAG TPA: hypothetical protein VJX92_12700 [Methylomirabilota bacterium]|nr:hypothetical protein [Methylomirabilota bacterium]
MTEAVLAAAVYLDTNVLRRLPADLTSPDLAKLTEITTILGIDIGGGGPG